MKRLITAKDVQDAAEKHKNLCVDDNTIVTAQARDYVKELGVLLVEGKVACAGHGADEAHAAEAPKCCAEEYHDCRADYAEKPCEKHTPAHTEPVLSVDEMERVIRAALDKGVWTAQQLSELLSGNGQV